MNSHANAFAKAGVGNAMQVTAAPALPSHERSVAEDSDPAMAAAIVASLMHSSQGGQVKTLDSCAVRS